MPNHTQGGINSFYNLVSTAPMLTRWEAAQESNCKSFEEVKQLIRNETHGSAGRTHQAQVAHSRMGISP